MSGQLHAEEHIKVIEYMYTKHRSVYEQNSSRLAIVCANIISSQVLHTLRISVKLTGICIEVTVLGIVLLSNAAGAIRIVMDHLHNIYRKVRMQ